MLTFTEAINFVSNKLKIPDAEVKLRERRLAFLEEYVLKFHQCVPFQNLSVLGKTAEDRAVPTPKEILEDCRTTIGGLCLSLSYFNFWVLQALGFESYTVLCDWALAKTDQFIHVSVIAENVENEGDEYFVEVGTSFPTLKPIPLHDLPQEYHDVFVRYRFAREGNTIGRYHLKPASKTEEAPSVPRWELMSKFETVHRSDDYIRSCLEPVYIQPGYASMFYLTEVRVTLYPEGSALTLAGSVLKVWKKETNELTVVELKNAEEFTKAIEAHFPMLASIVTERALSCLKFSNDDVAKKN